MKYVVVPTLKYYPSSNIPFDVYKFVWNSVACKLRQNNVSQAVFIAFKTKATRYVHMYSKFSHSVVSHSVEFALV